MKLCEKSNRLLREQKPEYVQTIEIIEISRESEPADEQMDFDLEFEDQDSDEAIEYEIIHLQTPTKVTQKATRSTIIKSPTSTRKESPVKSLKKEPQKALVPKEQSKVKSPEKRFVCDVCEKSFKAKMALNIHLRVHSNFRPHVCPVCLIFC